MDNICYDCKKRKAVKFNRCRKCLNKISKVTLDEWKHGGG